MRMSEKDFAVFLSKTNCKAEGVQPPAKKQRKHLNTRIYLHENGVAVPEKDIRFGKVITVFDSKKEYTRYLELKILEKAGKIRDLQKQVAMLIQDEFVNDGKVVRKIVYKADFKYIDCMRQKEVVEDVKAFDVSKQKYLTTKDFNIKWKLLKHKYPHIDFELY